MATWNIGKIGDQELKGEVLAAQNNFLPTFPEYDNYEIKIYGYDTSQLDINKETVVLIHGWLGASGDPFNLPLENADIGINIARLADELSPYYQVLFLDWSTAAEDDKFNINGISLEPPDKAAGRILPVANWVAGRLASIDNITLIGHSLGGLMSAAIGDILNPYNNVDIITLDAAITAQGNLGYDIERGSSEKEQVKDLKDVSDNSIALVVSDEGALGPNIGAIAGDTDYAATAKTSLLVKFNDFNEAHSNIQFVFENLLQKIDSPNKLEILEDWVSSFAKDEYNNAGIARDGGIFTGEQHEGVIQAVTTEGYKIEKLFYYLRDNTPQSINLQSSSKEDFTQFIDPILRPFEDPNDFGEQIMERNDDGSSTILDLPFPINFYGNVYDQFYINNNGNITFQNSLSGYTPQQFPVSNQPMMAPYWADVDTSNESSGLVYYGLPNEDTVLVTWENVGYYSSHADLTNTFQLVLRDRSDDTGNEGDFDIEFRYGNLEWTTGDASDGSSGFGGTPAQAGFDAGNERDFFILAGSFTENVLLLENDSNVSRNTPGLWSFAIRSGETPGERPENPLQPVTTDEGFNFDYFVQNPVEFVFIDPDIAIGYDYIVNSGPNIASVQIPLEVAGDDGVYNIFLPDENGNLIETTFAIQPNQIFDFTENGFPDGLASFGIRGIAENAMLDPTDSNAFVTGLQFVSSGLVNVSQNPVTIFVNSPPTDIQLNNLTIEENKPVSTIIGSLTTVDPDNEPNFTYTLVNGEGDTDNTLFTLNGNQLLANQSFDFETQNSYSIRVQTDDGNGGTFQKVFTINVSDVKENSQPTDINLSNNLLGENQPIDSVIGNFTTIDPDADPNFTYTLVNGEGDTDNGVFTLNGNQLLANQPFDFETKNSYSIRVQTDDGNGGTFEKVFTINVSDVDETPTLPSHTLRKVLGFNVTENTEKFFNSARFEKAIITTSEVNLTEIKITSLPENGTLKFDNETVSIDQLIPISEVSKLSFIPNNDFNGYANFKWNGSDGVNYAITDSEIKLKVLNTIKGTKNSDNLTGDGLFNFMKGYRGNDTISGALGDDILNGHEGDDILIGNQGDDILKGGLGDDFLIAGEGNDTLNGGMGNDTIDGGLNTDTARFFAETNVTLTGNEVIGQGTDTLLNIEKVELIGNSNDNLLNATNSTNFERVILRGKEGNDTLYGSQNNDLIYGGEGDDIIDGGNGINFLWGDHKSIQNELKGADTFVLHLGVGNRDIINDFEPNKDKLQLPENISFGDLSIKNTANNQDTVIKYQQDVLAVLKYLDSTLITESDFMIS